jgi:uncharacterized repeat protein (TIGR03803 family)
MRHATIFFLRFFAVIFLAAAVQSRAASQYTPLHGFAGGTSDGSGPVGSLATDGTMLYGFTPFGGSASEGVFFKISTSGSGYQILHTFAGLSFFGGTDGNDGAIPRGTPLLIGSTLYGTTQFGGTNGNGTVFKIKTDGTGFQLLHSFNSSDAYAPQCALVTDGTNLFGMTPSSSGDGAIFSIGTNGLGYHVLHNLSGTGNEGAAPQGSLLISGGILYGMTQLGGVTGSGTLFKIGTDGNGFQLVHNFTGTLTDGSHPYGSLIIANSTLFGTTSAGGGNNFGAVFSVDTSGTGFQILHSFSSADTWSPQGDLTLSGSTLYGMARNSGLSLLGFGTIFQVNTDGSGFQIPHVFSYSGLNLTDGSTPVGSLLLLGSQFFGMTQSGGSSHNAGALFSFTPTSSGGGGGPVTALRVTIQPSTAVKAGAQWQVNGGPLFNSGALASNLTSGAHVVSYKAVTGFITPAPQIIDITAGVTNAITGTYGVADTAAPVLKIVSPTSKTVAISNLFTAIGTATDDSGVAGVYYQLNGGAWTPAATANGWSNWTANLNLTAGPNVLNVYAKDTNNNLSPTNAVTFTFTVNVPVTVNINIPGSGTVSPNLNGQIFPIGGKALKLGAKAAKGFAFVNWTGATNTSSSKISFVVESNLVFNANFKDITRPVDVILVPTKGQVLSNSVASGRAMDNVGVTAIYYQLNGGDWAQANSGDGTNWQTADLSAQLLAGPNTISSYALDAAGNASLTNTIAFSYAVLAAADWAPNSLNGLLAAVSPNGGAAEALGFDQMTFSQTSSSNDGDPEDYGGGTYTYLKTDTNHAQLSLAFNAPPGNSNDVGAINLVFTNHYSGYFTNDSAEFGGLNLLVANAVVPTTLVGKTLTAVSGNNGKTTKIKLTSATAFTKTPANNSSSGSSAGTYTFTRLSPLCVILSATFTSPADASQTAYLQLTYTSATSGSYFVMVFDNLGVLQDIDVGTFTM